MIKHNEEDNTYIMSAEVYEKMQEDLVDSGFRIQELRDECAAQHGHKTILLLIAIGLSVALWYVTN